MYTPYPRLANPLTQLDATAKNTPGTVYAPPPGSFPAGATVSPTQAVSTPGYGAPPVIKYVYFNTVTGGAPTAQAAPAPVYYTDTSFTQVSANPADGFGGVNPAFALAGFWMPNTTNLGSSQTAAQWGATFQGSYGWVQIGGWLPSAYLSAGVAGDYIYGAATTNWNIASTATYTNRVAGFIQAVAANIGSVLLGAPATFWGS